MKNISDQGIFGGETMIYAGDIRDHCMNTKYYYNPRGEVLPSFQKNV